MRYSFAPLEGVTGYLYRNAHRRYFGGVDKYYLPFLSPSAEHSFTQKSFVDILPAHNEGLVAVPQLLTKCAPDFIWAANELEKLGYPEVNLNLGCPSGTVTAKGKGAGFLASPDQLDRFLEEVFSAVRLPVSIKTRLGISEPDEFDQLLEIYNKYPLTELIIHARVREDFYKRPARPEAFAKALAASRNPVCYNGDLLTAADCAAFSARFPTVDSVMLGRGLVANPALVAVLKGGVAPGKATLQAFHDELYESYCAAFGSRQNAMRRMKELWFYLICLFEDSGSAGKKLKKATDPRDFEAVTAGIFRDLALRTEALANW
ncbi:MAG: tRNA-dihydrouridine synthase family protein [Oscillospiraceae bacterium]